MFQLLVLLFIKFCFKVNQWQIKESAKLHALHAKNVLVCQHALRAYMPCVLTCSHALRAYVPTCLACSRANVPCVLTCSRAKHALRAYVLVCKRAILNNVNLSIIQIC